MDVDSPAVGYIKLATNYIASTRPAPVQPLYIRSDEDCALLAEKGAALAKLLLPEQLINLSPKASAGLALATAVVVMYMPAVMAEMQYRRLVSEQIRAQRAGIRIQQPQPPAGTAPGATPPGAGAGEHAWDGLYNRPAAAVNV